MMSESKPTESVIREVAQAVWLPMPEELAKGAENAFYRGRKTLSKVYRKVGFIQPAR